MTPPRSCLRSLILTRTEVAGDFKLVTQRSLNFAVLTGTVTSLHQLLTQFVIRISNACLLRVFREAYVKCVFRSLRCVFRNYMFSLAEN